MQEKTLYERIGGEAAVNAAVAKMYEKIMADAFLLPFFEGVDMKKQHRSQVAFVTVAFGGPHHYSGKGLRNAHRRLVEEKGLSDTHFDAVATHLTAAMRELGVAEELINEAIGIVATTRNDVLGR